MKEFKDKVAVVTARDKVPQPAGLRLIERLSYGVGNFAEVMIFTPATTFMVFFYTEVAGIAAATVGTILLISRVFDLFNPVMGLIVDRTNSRFGKGRPWLLWMAIPFGISTVLLFTVPPLGMTAKIIYAFVTYNLAATVVYAAIDIPYGAMIALETPSQNERTMLSVFRQSFSMAGMMTCFAITLPLVQFFGGGAQGWQRAFIVFGVVATTLLLVCFLGTKERLKPNRGSRAEAPVSVRVRALLSNSCWLLLTIAMVALFLMFGLFGDNIYYCRYILRNVNLFGPLMTISQLALIAGIVFISPFLQKLGKRNTALAGIGVAIVGQAIMFVAPANFNVVVIGTTVKSLGCAPLVGTMFAMLADTVEYGEWKTGLRDEGLSFGALTLINKMSVGLGAVLLGWVLGISGYRVGLDAQSASVLFAVKLMFLHLPLVLLIVMGIALWMYNLDKEYPCLIEELRLRHLAESSGLPSEYYTDR